MNTTLVTHRQTILTMAFNALCEKLVTDVAVGDDAILNLTTRCLSDPDGSLSIERPTPDHRLDPAEPASWSTQSNPDLLSAAKAAANLLDITIAAGCTPDGADEIRRTTGRIARALGVTVGRARAYCEIGTMLARMPQTSAAVSCGVFSLDLLRILSDVTCAVDSAHLERVDADIAELLTPTRPRQAVPGPVILRRAATRIVGIHQPTALPVDPDAQDVPPPELQTDFTVDTRNPEQTCFHITLPASEATGITRIIDAVAAAHDCSRASAFSELVHGGISDVKVTLNCYRNIDSGEMHLENQWLDQFASDRWARRVTHLAVPSHSAHDGRFATDNQKALLAGVDGTCRSPGCENPASVADADHVHRYDDDPRTDSELLQGLCRQCHNEKTRGLLDYTRHPDGATSVTSIDDGHTVTTVPTGPMAKAVLTFDQALARTVKAREEHEAARWSWRIATTIARTIADQGTDNHSAAGEEIPF
jgi:hypothetical protein